MLSNSSVFQPLSKNVIIEQIATVGSPTVKSLITATPGL